MPSQNNMRSLPIMGLLYQTVGEDGSCVLKTKKSLVD
jgi:hypothetical protein